MIFTCLVGDGHERKVLGLFLIRFFNGFLWEIKPAVFPIVEMAAVHELNAIRIEHKREMTFERAFVISFTILSNFYFDLIHTLFNSSSAVDISFST